MDPLIPKQIKNRPLHKARCQHSSQHEKFLNEAKQILDCGFGHKGREEK